MKETDSKTTRRTARAGRARQAGVALHGEEAEDVSLAVAPGVSLLGLALGRGARPSWADDCQRPMGCRRPPAHLATGLASALSARRGPLCPAGR